ncbi:hypothetical protein TYRP_004851 [Tyrophagus putrescentiae]|nr:hypothetical protein TYRP_004851 [Tyrophagus putrescentiae]
MESNNNYNANNGLDDKMDYESGGGGGGGGGGGREQRAKKCPVQLLFLFASAIIALMLFILLLSQGVPWSNFEMFCLSIVTIVLIGSIVGLIIGTIRTYCWKTSISTNPTPITLYTNPPPIGSAEAEFQNEYIPVFPMRQLKPRENLDIGAL